MINRIRNIFQSKSSSSSSSSLSSTLSSKQYYQSDQELIDTFRAFLSTHTYYHYNQHHIQQSKGYNNITSSSIPRFPSNAGVGGDDDVNQDEQYLKDMMNVAYVTQQSSIDDVVDYQIHALFQHVHDIGGMNSYPPTSLDTTVHLDNTLDAKIKRSLIIKQENVQGSLIQHPFHDFSIRIKRSSIDHQEAGYGVHVEGEVKPGTVLAIYPGDTYITGAIDSAAIKDNEYMISRYDGTIIDGRSWMKKVDMSVYRSKYFENTGSDVSSSELFKYRNPFAIGQFINHPSSTSHRANVIGIRYNFPTTFPSHLRQYIPHSKMSDTSFFRDKTILQKSFILIASQHIVDQELLLNYRYNPQHPYPQWYHQPDLEEASRRWGQIKRFSLKPLVDRLQ